MNLPLNIDWQQILLHLFNFVILGGGLYLLLYRPIKKFMDKRIDGYRQMDEKAGEKMQEAENLKAKYEKEMAEADHQIAEKKKEADAAMQKSKEMEEADAKTKAEAIIAKARKEADLERERILHDAQRQIRDMVEEATEKLVKKSVHDVYEEFLATDQSKEEQGE